MAGCSHGMDATWCYLCRVDAAGGDPQVLWGVALDDDLSGMTRETGPMTPPVAAYLRFLGPEVGLASTQPSLRARPPG